MKIIGLIPARKGSKRIPGKNLAFLGGITLLRRCIESAQSSDVFDEIVVSSDWDECLGVALINGAGRCPRPPEISGDGSHDFEFVKHALDNFPGHDVFMILRPTSPFRTGQTIKNALASFKRWQPADSLRAVEPTTAHPGKSWRLRPGGQHIEPYLESSNALRNKYGVPGTYDLPTQRLERVFVQNACIHIGWTANIKRFGNVTGTKVIPYFTQGDEGIDINTPEDLQYAGWIMDQKQGPNDWRGTFGEGGHT
jgi:CMP-N,N'-diacetyllegionaminic acid synthase